MIYRIHRGGTHYTPENTMPAFRTALEGGGYSQIETDPQLTRDGQIVLMHDGTINRTCRNEDGSPIAEPIRVAEHTYEELLRYDAGIAFSEAFRGTRIPLLHDLLTLAEGSGVSISLDKKIDDDHVEALVDVVRAHNVPVSFSASSVARIRRIQALLPDASFDFDVNTEEETLREVARLVAPEKLIVWLYMNKPNFAWLAEKAKVTPENVARVRRYARLGIANVNNSIDAKEAFDILPDVLEV